MFVLPIQMQTIRRKEEIQKQTFLSSLYLQVTLVVAICHSQLSGISTTKNARAHKAIASIRACLILSLQIGDSNVIMVLVVFLMVIRAR